MLLFMIKPDVEDFKVPCMWVYWCKNLSQLKCQKMEGYQKKDPRISEIIIKISFGVLTCAIMH